MARRTPFAIGQFYVEAGAPPGALVRTLVVTDLGPDALGLERVTFRRPDGGELAIWVEQAELAVAVGHLIPVPQTPRSNGVAA